MSSQFFVLAAAGSFLLVGIVSILAVLQRSQSGEEPGRMNRRIARVAGIAYSESNDDDLNEGSSDSLFIQQRQQRGPLRWVDERFTLTGGTGILSQGILIWIGVGIVLTILGALLFRLGTLSLLAGPVAGLGVAWFVLSLREKRQRKEFTKVFPEVVDHIVRLSRAGVPAVEAISIVANEAPEPVGPILEDVASRLSSGLEPDLVVREVAEKLRIAEFTLFTSAICLQRTTGGGITRPMTNLAATLRERREIALKAHGATAQTRASLWVLGAVPVVVSGLQWSINPATTDFLFNTDSGIALVRWGVGLIVLGLLVAREISTRAIR